MLHMVVVIEWSDYVIVCENGDRIVDLSMNKIL